MTIREATPADRPRLVEMALRFLQETPPYQLFPSTPAALSWIIAVVLEHGVALVAETDVGLVGMIGLVVAPHPLTGETFADEIVWWVEPEWRLGSVGPRLLDAVERWVVTKNVNSIRMVSPKGSAVGEFYERRGYQEVETSYLKRL